MTAGVGMYGTGRGYPAPGLQGGPPRLSEMVAAIEIPVRRDDSIVLNFHGLKIDIPTRASVRVDDRAGRVWVRSAGRVAQFTPQGRETVTREGERLLLESWDTL